MKKFAWLLGLLVLVSLGVVSYVGFRFLEQEGFKDANYDRYPPEIEAQEGRIRILLFSKTNGRRHESIPAAVTAFQELADLYGWSVFATENGAVHDAEILERFDLVIWNNVSGDVLLPGQRGALQLWIQDGGRWFGIHGTGGNRDYSWDWRQWHMIGARFKGHTLFPEVRAGTLTVENALHPIVQGLPEEWSVREAWYSFHESPRNAGAQVVLSVDEASYSPFDYLQMGTDHPVVWFQAVKNGVTLYSALGHTPQIWQDDTYRRFLRNTVEWLVSPRSAPVGPPEPLELDAEDEESDADVAEETDPFADVKASVEQERNARP